MSQYVTIITDLRELKVEADCRSLTWRPIEKEIAISSVDDKENRNWVPERAISSTLWKSTEMRNHWHLLSGIVYLLIYLFSFIHLIPFCIIILNLNQYLASIINKFVSIYI